MPLLVTLGLQSPDTQDLEARVEELVERLERLEQVGERDM